MAKRDYFVKYPNGNIIKTSHPEYHKEGEVLSQKQGQAEYTEQVKNELLSWVKPGDTVYTILRSVSRSGMSRTIGAFVIVDGLPRRIDWHIATVLGWKQDGDGVKVSGCGMDMGFHLVYTLGRHLFPNGVDIGRQGEPDKEGGYALKQVWF